ncbi:MAG: hypothetical protein H7A46_17680 [Verrucomicrobiales bacterium]|nr:hypothetical protein [Verrucomicrobiales bacterium]
MTAKPSKRPRPPGMVQVLGWGRLLLIPPILGALLLIWWSVQRLVPVQTEVRDISDELTRMNLEMDAMGDRIKNAGGAEEIREGFSKAQSLLLPGRAGVEGWLRELNAAAIPLGLDVRVTFGMADNRHLSNHVVTVIPATIAVRVRREANDQQSPYRRLLDLTQFLTRTPYRVDLVGLDARASDRSIESALLNVQLWSSELQTDAP